MEKQKVRSSTINLEEFVIVWSKSDSIEEVVEHFKRSPAYVKNLYYRLKKHNVPLKKLSLPRRNRIDYNRLAKLAQEEMRTRN